MSDLSRKLANVMRGSIVVGCVVVALLGVVALFVFSDTLMDVKPFVPPLSTSDRDANRELKVAFREPPQNREGEHRELEMLFTRLAHATANRETARWMECFDTNRLTAECQYADLGEPLALEDRTNFLASVREAVRNLGQSGGFTGTVSPAGATPTVPTIWRVRPLPGGRDCVVITRLTTNADSIPQRWWLTKTDEGYQIYDVEDVRMGLKLTDQLAYLTTRPGDDAAMTAQAKAVQNLRKTMLHMNSGELAKAQASLKLTRDQPLPRGQLLVQHLLEGSLALAEHHPASALEWADRAENVRPGTPAILLLRAAAFDQLGQAKNCLAAITEYTAELGPDPHAARLAANAHEQLGQHAEANQVVEAARKLFPDARCLNPQ